MLLILFKDELKHFDHKISKHKHYVQEMEDSERLLKQGHGHRKEKHDSLVEKAKEHARWVRTFHSLMSFLCGKSTITALCIGQVLAPKVFKVYQT